MAKKPPGRRKDGNILEELRRERSVSQICREHGISQAQYYKQRDRFLEVVHPSISSSTPPDDSGNREYIYAAGGLEGLFIFDVSDPAANPQLIGHYDTAGRAWGVAVSGDYAYVADDYNGLVVIDISNQYCQRQSNLNGVSCFLVHETKGPHR